MTRLEITLRFRKREERKKKFEPSSGGNKRSTVRIHSSSALHHHHLSAYTTHIAGYRCTGTPQRSKEMGFSVIRRGPIRERTAEVDPGMKELRDAGLLLTGRGEKMTATAAVWSCRSERQIESDCSREGGGGGGGGSSGSPFHKPL